MNDRVTALDEAALEKIREIGSADIVIGIPSYNNADTIGRVIKAADIGLAKYFRDRRSVIIVSEGGDPEATRKAVEELIDRQYFSNSFVSLPDKGAEMLVTKYRGTSGKGTAVKAIFEVASLLGAKGGCMLDSDLRSISPEWIELLLAPVLYKGFGFVAPYYNRHKYDGTITNMIAFPLTWALYGRRVRQPIGGDFGFSGELIESLLSKDVWETDIARFGIDIWMTTVAICENYKICQSYLGAKIHDEKDPGKDLGPMFKQVVGTIFRLMSIYEDRWMQVRGSRPTAIFGFESEYSPKPIEIDMYNMIFKFRDSARDHLHVWEMVLENENCAKLKEVSEMDPDKFEMPADLWIKCLYDFAVAYNLRTDSLDAGRIIEALVPIYYATTASFISRTQNLDCHQAEEIITQQCAFFEKMKPYIVERWNSVREGRAAR